MFHVQAFWKGEEHWRNVKETLQSSQGHKLLRSTSFFNKVGDLESTLQSPHSPQQLHTHLKVQEVFLLFHKSAVWVFLYVYCAVFPLSSQTQKRVIKRKKENWKITHDSIYHFNWKQISEQWTSEEKRMDIILQSSDFRKSFGPQQDYLNTTSDDLLWDAII